MSMERRRHRVFVTRHTEYHLRGDECVGGLCDDTPIGVARTIKAAIELVGEDHVALGSDYDGTVTTGYDTSELAALTQAMLDVGLTEEQIRKVAGENMVRVLRARLN